LSHLAFIGEMQNYYDILEVPNHASKKEIRRAYLDKCKQFHPDLHDGADWAEAKLKLVNEAYETLSDTFRRHDYDNQMMRQNAPEKAKQIIPSIEDIKQRPVWLYGSILAITLWLVVVGFALYPSNSQSVIENSPATKNEYRRFLEFCRTHPGVMTRSEFQTVLDQPIQVGFTFELNNLIAKGDTLGLRQKIRALE